MAKKYNDQDMSTNLLISLKHLKAELNTFTQEASNTDLYNKVTALYDSISTLQRDVFDMMCKQGWYAMTSESKANITKAYTKAKKAESDLA